MFEILLCKFSMEKKTTKRKNKTKKMRIERKKLKFSELN